MTEKNWNYEYDRALAAGVIRQADPLHSRTVLPDEIDEDPIPPKVGSLEWYMGEHTVMRDRIAELEAQHAAQVKVIEEYQRQQGQDRTALQTQIREGRQLLDARIADLEADVDMSATHAISVLEASLASAQEGERRKREECERLELQLGEIRRQNNRLERERTELREANGYLVTEERRLRRELGKKR
jgi:chromosome segregation ATPase